MSNRERAAALLTPNREHCQRVHKGEGGYPCMFCEYSAETAADMLADAGLLAPDLPEPNFQGAWHTDSTSVRLDSNVTSRVALNLWFGEGDASIRLTVEEAREVAHALLAAVSETEKRA